MFIFILKLNKYFENSEQICFRHIMFHFETNNIFICEFIYYFIISTYAIILFEFKIKYLKCIHLFIYKSKYEYFKILFKAVLKLTILVSINLNL